MDLNVCFFKSELNYSMSETSLSFILCHQAFVLVQSDITQRQLNSVSQRTIFNQLTEIWHLSFFPSLPPPNGTSGLLWLKQSPKLAPHPPEN